MSWKAKGQVFEKSYDEVLAALKHQDEKLNRTLTAIAFLTAAGVAIFASVSMRIPAPRFPGEAPTVVTSFFFVAFLSAAVFALVFALAAIGPSEALPRLRKRSTPQAKEQWPSLLFYARMLRDADWSSHIDRDASWLEECIARNYHSEAHTLAQRVDYKVARSRESGAFVQVAVLSLSLLGVFSVGQLSLATRWWVAAVMLTSMMVLPLWDGLLMFRFGFKTSRAMKERATAYAAALASGALGSVLLFTAPSWHSHWWALSYALASILATRLAVAHERFALLRSFLLAAVAIAAIPVLLVAWLS